jgi:hypothetical protein
LSPSNRANLPLRRPKRLWKQRLKQILDPLSFRCPVCRSKVAAFRDIGPRTKASGFEENLNYGLGVNRMTPGQKNVLIFGSLALGFAFFLSLYSLR